MNNIAQESFIEVEKFKMRFGNKTVIEDLSFEVKRGEVFGFLGSNGSGKTTTIRALLGIYRPTAGKLLIDGKPFTPANGAFLGYLPEERGLYKRESVIDTMIYFGRLKGMPRQAAQTWALEYLERVGLSEKADDEVSSLSGGQQQKVQMGVTIMNDPGLLILDEPTKGFDPVNRQLMLEIVEECSRKGATVILVTHQMEEVEQLCDRVVLLKDGVRRLYGSVEEIKRQYGSNQIEIRFKGKLQLENELYTIVHSTATGALLTPREGVGAEDIFRALAQQEVGVDYFVVKHASLNDIFIQIYQAEKEGLHA